MGFLYFAIWVWGSAWWPFWPPELGYDSFWMYCIVRINQRSLIQFAKWIALNPNTTVCPAFWSACPSLLLFCGPEHRGIINDFTRFDAYTTSEELHKRKYITRSKLKAGWDAGILVCLQEFRKISKTSCCLHS